MRRESARPRAVCPAQLHFSAVDSPQIPYLKTRVAFIKITASHMETVVSFHPGHQDLVHSIAYDYYGCRIATCSSDQKVKVWNKEEAPNERPSTGAPPTGHRWALNDSWKAHDAAVLKVAWANPEFGQVLATCSFDRSIRIWEEQSEESKQSGRRWLEKARLVDSRGTVQDIQFAPSHQGLKLATVSVYGVLRIYEAMDVINLAHWTLTEDFEVGVSSKEKDTEYCLSWCQARTLPPMLVVGCGKDYTAKIFRYDETARKWSLAEQLPGHMDLIRSVAWAPTMGRNYQLIATGCKDRRVRIFKLTEESNEGTLSQFRVALVAELDETEGHDSEVWSVEWNLTGSILASSGDDGRVILWKADLLGVWKRMAVLSGDGQQMMLGADGIGFAQV